MPIYHKGAFLVAKIEESYLRQSKAAVNRTWQRFLHGGTNHSAKAETLTEIINRCERDGIPYVLEAWPGHGYYIKPGKRIDAAHLVADLATTKED